MAIDRALNKTENDTGHKAFPDSQQSRHSTQQWAQEGMWRGRVVSGTQHLGYEESFTDKNESTDLHGGNEIAASERENAQQKQENTKKKG